MSDMWTWLTDSANWSGDEGIWHRLAQHLAYSVMALFIAAVIAIPVGLWIGHTGRGRFVVVNLVGAMRALPSLGLLFMAVLWLGPHLSGDTAYLVPTEIVLVAIAIPPLLAGAYAGVEQVDAAARDAARGMGMTGTQVLRRVEIPCALPLLISGARSATLQVVATATLAALVSLGGLGRYLVDGLAIRDYGQMAGGALLVAGLALALDCLWIGVERIGVSPGLSRRHTTAPTERPA